MAEPSAKNEAKSTGAARGFLWVASAKVSFMVTAFGVQIVLTHLLSGAEFGRFSAAFGLVMMLNNVVVVATLQTMSKLVSEAPERADQTLRRGLLYQLIVGFSLASLFSLAAWPISASYGDEAMRILLQVPSVVIFAYSLHGALVGYLNGKRQFNRQAQVDISFSILRSVGFIGGALLLTTALGPLIGLSIAAVCIVLVAASMAGLGKSGDSITWKRWFVLLRPIVIYHAALNLVLQSDLQILKWLMRRLYEADGQENALELANILTGHYKAAQLFAFTPYQLILSVTFIVFPLLSQAMSVGDRQKVKDYIHNAMRFSLLVVMSVAAPISGAASGAFRIALMNETFTEASNALSILVFGVAAFALFVIGATMLTGVGRPWTSVVVAVVAFLLVALCVPAAIYFAHRFGIDPLVATATGTATGMLFALSLVAWVVSRSFGAFLPWLSVLRAGLASAAAFFAARFIPHHTALLALVALALGFAVYLLVLALLRELRPSDIAQLKSALGKK